MRKVAIEKVISECEKSLKYGSPECFLNRRAAATKEYLEELLRYRATGLTPEEIAELNDFSNSQCAKLLAENAELKRREKAAVEDMQFIHCAGRWGCEICLNNDVCKRQDVRIGKCPEFDWRGPVAGEESR